MEPEDDLNRDKDTSTAEADDSDSRAHTARRIAATATSMSPRNGKQNSAVPEDPSDAFHGGLVLTPLLGFEAKTPMVLIHAWAMLREWAGHVVFPTPAPHIK